MSGEGGMTRHLTRGGGPSARGRYRYPNPGGSLSCGAAVPRRFLLLLGLNNEAPLMVSNGKMVETA